MSVSYSNPDKSPQGPKVGVIDPNGEPHMGGNTFAGGSGILFSIYLRKVVMILQVQVGQVVLLEWMVVQQYISCNK